MASNPIPASHEEFRRDMEKAGRKVIEYNGRFFYHGPAVTINKDDLQDIMRETEVRLKWDDMGKGLVVYPA